MKMKSEMKLCSECQTQAICTDGKFCFEEDCRQRKALCPSDATACSPFFVVRKTMGNETIEIHMPTTKNNPLCWDRIDLKTAKKMRNELFGAVDQLESLLDLREFNAENAKTEGPPTETSTEENQ